MFSRWSTIPSSAKGSQRWSTLNPTRMLVGEACDGQEAIEKFRLHRPDVTLMDLQMPALNGIEAIIGIRSEFPNARIIVLTTYTGDVQVLRALKAGGGVTY